MDMSEIRSEVAQFFDEFVVAFESFDGIKIAERYVAPYVALHADGSLECFATHDQVGQYFQRVVDAYRAKGCRSCRYNDLAIASLGRECGLGTVTWELLARDQTVLSSWRESYNLCRVEGRLRVFASVDHVV